MTAGSVKSSSETAIAAELASLVGERNVISDFAELENYAIDGTTPAAAVSPGSPEEVASVLKVASERKWSVVPAGGMTQQGFGATPECIDVVLRTNRLKDVLHYDPADLTLGVGAGTTLAEVDALVGARAQMLPIDAAQAERSTIGGVMATAAHGPLRHGYGSVRDYCIGIKFVTGDGVIAKGGGRVVKNVAGYDLMKLLIGSHGTLGVIVSANFKVLPRPRQTRTFGADFGSAKDALTFRDFVLKSPLTPMCLEIASPHAHEYLADAGPVRDPDRHVPESVPEHKTRWTVLVRAAGSDALQARYRRELGTAITFEIGGEEESMTWRRFAGFAPLVFDRHHNAMAVHISCAIQDAGASLLAFENAALNYNFLPACVGQCGAGSLLAAFVPLAVDPPSAVNFAAAVSDLRGALPPSASAIVARCPVEAKRHFDVWGGESVDVVTMRGVRAALDPHGVLNKGRFLV